MADPDSRIPGLEDVSLIEAGPPTWVYRAFQPKFHRHVAVKVVGAAHLDDAARHRFEQEQRTLGALSNHPGIVTLFDAGFTADGSPYLVMELMPGGSMADLLHRQGPLPWQEAVAVLGAVTDAVSRAHDRGVVHGDIRPGNILVSEFGEPKLSDFAIAGIVGDAVAGDPAALPYAAPEVLAGGEPTRASDVYALAATLFTLVSGRPPYPVAPGDTPETMLARVRSSPVADLRAEGLPGSILDLIDIGIAASPSDRPPTAAAFRSLLRDLALAAEVGPGAGATRVVTPAMVADAAGTAEQIGATRRLIPGEPPAEVPPVPAHRRRRGAGGGTVAVLATVVGALGTAAAFLLLGGDGGAPGSRYSPAPPAGSAGFFVLYEQAGEEGPDPFLSIAEREEVTGTTLPPPRPDARGLVGGTLEQVCDRELLIWYLYQYPARGEAWAGASGITFDQIPSFIRDLTPEILDADTRVTNHGYAGGEALPRQTFLQEGTAVMVDGTGRPRVRCHGGSPLGPPRDPPPPATICPCDVPEGDTA